MKMQKMDPFVCVWRADVLPPPGGACLYALTEGWDPPRKGDWVYIGYTTGYPLTLESGELAVRVKVRGKRMVVTVSEAVRAGMLLRAPALKPKWDRLVTEEEFNEVLAKFPGEKIPVLPIPDSYKVVWKPPAGEQTLLEYVKELAHAYETARDLLESAVAKIAPPLDSPDATGEDGAMLSPASRMGHAVRDAGLAAAARNLLVHCVLFAHEQEMLGDIDPTAAIMALYRRPVVRPAFPLETVEWISDNPWARELAKAEEWERVIINNADLICNALRAPQRLGGYYAGMSAEKYDAEVRAGDIAFYVEDLVRWEIG